LDFLKGIVEIVEQLSGSKFHFRGAKMRDNIDPQKPLAKLLLISRGNWTHPNGTRITEGDRDGYRAVMRTGETRVFMSLTPGDLSYDWLDVTDQTRTGHFLVCERE
jgi:hypothetical protein